MACFELTRECNKGHPPISAALCGGLTHPEIQFVSVLESPIDGQRIVGRLSARAVPREIAEVTCAVC
jgi:hypothetical protein